MYWFFLPNQILSILQLIYLASAYLWYSSYSFCSFILFMAAYPLSIDILLFYSYLALFSYDLSLTFSLNASAFSIALPASSPLGRIMVGLWRKVLLQSTVLLQAVRPSGCLQSLKDLFSSGFICLYFSYNSSLNLIALSLSIFSASSIAFLLKAASFSFFCLI